MHSLKRLAGEYPVALTPLSQDNSPAPNDLPQGLLAQRDGYTLIAG